MCGGTHPSTDVTETTIDTDACSFGESSRRSRRVKAGEARRTQLTDADRGFELLGEVGRTSEQVGTFAEPSRLRRRIGEPRGRGRTSEMTLRQRDTETDATQYVSDDDVVGPLVAHIVDRDRTGA
jgi:hypothetical protein